MIYLFIFLGLFFGLTLIRNLIIFIILSLLVALFLFFRFRKRILISYLISFSIGLGLSLLSIQLNPSSGTYLGIVIEAKENYVVIWSKFERIYVYSKNNNFEFGDILKITGNLTNIVDTSLESEFSFSKYLFNKGVFRQLNFSNIESVFSNFIKIKAYKQYFLGLFDGNAKDLIDALLFNVKNYDGEFALLANNLNISYLFSVTGIYISLVFKAVEYLLFLKLNEKHSKLFSMVFLSWYLIFALNKVGIRRVLYLKIFSYINKFHLKKKFDYIEQLSIIGILMLSFNHYLAYQQAFYIGLFISIFYYFTSNTLSRGRKKKVISKKAIVLFLFTLPISLASSYSFHPLGVFIQWIITPFTLIYSMLGLIAFYTYPIKAIFNSFSTGIIYCMKGLSYIDYSIPFKYFSAYWLLFYYLFLLSSIYFLENYSFKKCYVSISIISGLCLLQMIPFEYLYADSITFLNVGQGDSAVIRHKNKTIMIDTGGLTYKDVATSSTIPYLNKKGIWKLDYVFISHSDNDHTGALNSLKENFIVKNVIDTSEPFTITIDDLEIQNINLWANDFSDINDKSQVLKFKAANRNILMMGDASTNIENKIIEYYSSLDIDVIKIGHHGSKSSSSYEFLKYINPKEAVISVGYNNYYGHPDKEVLTNLTSLNIKYKRTDLNGSISYYSNSILRA